VVSLFFLPQGVEFDRLCHQVIAHPIERLGKLAADQRQALAAIGGCNKEFLSRFLNRLSNK
jgi:hypothetical protein